MIGGLPIEYAQARLQARYGQRGDEPLWVQIRSARSFGAVLETLRASPLRRWVTAIPVDADADEVELRLRAELRGAIAEVASWMPDEWHPALLWTAHLVDLPAVARLASGEPSLPWMKRDAVLQQYAEADADLRRAALRNGPLAAVVRAIEGQAAEGATRHPAAAEAVARTTWLDEWRRRWPDRTGEDALALEALARLFNRHLPRFAELGAEEAWALRLDLETQVATRFRRHALTPVAAFAYLALVALDLERLRGHLVVRAAFNVVP
jgi:hypothetical protein